MENKLWNLRLINGEMIYFNNPDDCSEKRETYTVHGYIEEKLVETIEENNTKSNNKTVKVDIYDYVISSPVIIQYSHKYTSKKLIGNNSVLSEQEITHWTIKFEAKEDDKKYKLVPTEIIEYKSTIFRTAGSSFARQNRQYSLNHNYYEYTDTYQDPDSAEIYYVWPTEEEAKQLIENKVLNGISFYIEPIEPKEDKNGKLVDTTIER